MLCCVDDCCRVPGFVTEHVEAFAARQLQAEAELLSTITGALPSRQCSDRALYALEHCIWAPSDPKAPGNYLLFLPICRKWGIITIENREMTSAGILFSRTDKPQQIFLLHPILPVLMQFPESWYFLNCFIILPGGSAASAQVAALAERARHLGVTEAVCAEAAAAAEDRDRRALADLQLAVDSKPFDHRVFAARCAHGSGWCLAHGPRTELIWMPLNSSLTGHWCCNLCFLTSLKPHTLDYGVSYKWSGQALVRHCA